MKIQSIEYFKVEMPLAIPYTIAYETVDHATNIILKLTTNTGLTSWGCASPDKQVTLESVDDVLQNIENVVVPLLKNQSPFQISKVNHLLKQQLNKSSSTLAIVDMALYDMLARKAQLPLYKLLGGYRNSIKTSITITILPLEETLKQAKEFKKKGFSVIKLKGGLNLNEDIEKIIKLREVLGNEVALRFDANQGYSRKQSIIFMDKTKEANIEIFEQPTHQDNNKRLGKVTNSSETPVMADESIKTLSDAYHLVSNNLINMVNIKLMKVGGILEAQHINSVAKAAGMEVMIGCLDECQLGISAGLHFALSRPNIEFADLDGHLDLLNDPFKDLFKLEKGIIYPSDYEGLGKVIL